MEGSKLTLAGISAEVFKLATRQQRIAAIWPGTYPRIHLCGPFVRGLPAGTDSVIRGVSIFFDYPPAPLLPEGGGLFIFRRGILKALRATDKPSLNFPFGPNPRVGA